MSRPRSIRVRSFVDDEVACSKFLNAGYPAEASSRVTPTEGVSCALRSRSSTSRDVFRRPPGALPRRLRCTDGSANRCRSAFPHLSRHALQPPKQLEWRVWPSLVRLSSFQGTWPLAGALPPRRWGSGVYASGSAASSKTDRFFSVGKPAPTRCFSPLRLGLERAEPAPRNAVDAPCDHRVRTSSASAREDVFALTLPSTRGPWPTAALLLRLPSGSSGIPLQGVEVGNDAERWARSDVPSRPASRRPELGAAYGTRHASRRKLFFRVLQERASSGGAHAHGSRRRALTRRPGPGAPSYETTRRRRPASRGRRAARPRAPRRDGTGRSRATRRASRARTATS